MANISIIYHSGYGHTAKQAEAVLAGLRAVPDVKARLITAEEATKDLSQFASDDCLIFGCPTYMGGPSAQFKTFIDATSKVWFKQGWKDKLAAGFTNSGSPSGDKLSTLSSLVVMAMQHSMIWVGTGLLPANSKASTRNDINYLGGSGGALAQSPSDSSPDEGPLSGDLETAKIFGARIVEVSQQFNKGRS